jgi:hypothetical protein
VPPPATALSVPPITAAKNRKMAWLKCKREIYHGSLPGHIRRKMNEFPAPDRRLRLVMSH